MKTNRRIILIAFAILLTSIWYIKMAAMGTYVVSVSSDTPATYAQVTEDYGKEYNHKKDYYLRTWTVINKSYSWIPFIWNKEVVIIRPPELIAK